MNKPAAHILTLVTLLIAVPTLCYGAATIGYKVMGSDISLLPLPIEWFVVTIVGLFILISIGLVSFVTGYFIFSIYKSVLNFYSRTLS